MLVERAGRFARIWSEVQELGIYLADDDNTRQQQIEKVNSFCDSFVKACKKFGWESLSDHATRFKENVQDRLTRKEEKYVSTPQQEREAVSVLWDDFNTAIWNQLWRERCLVLDKSQRNYYEQESPLFGEKVASSFFRASQDIAEAGRCFALGRWTASVFHLMRVLELGLAALATELGISFEFENWHTVIERIESEIRKLDGLPKGPGKSEKLQKYSEAAKQFRYFKDAWRNHVSHSRVTYDETQSETIMRHVREFMQDLVVILATPPTP